MKTVGKRAYVAAYEEAYKGPSLGDLLRYCSEKHSELVNTGLRTRTARAKYLFIFYSSYGL